MWESFEMSDMSIVCSGAEDFLYQFRKQVAEERIPISGSMDLTHRCNLRCVHCYLDPQGNKKQNIQEEMNTDQVIGILDEITAAGCLYLLITGGEPLLRGDFSQIYQHMKGNGLLVTIFSNGTLISERIMNLFEDLPPKAVEISLYGATADTYEKITGVKGSFARCMKGIQGLLDHGINLRLKTVLMTANRHELDKMEQLARNFGVSFRFDAALFPRFNGDTYPVELRVSPEEAIEREFSGPERRLGWEKFFEHFKEVSFSNNLYECGAGLTNFHIEPYGNLQPCLMSIGEKFSILGGKFLEGWETEMPDIRKIKLNPDHLCHDCPKRILCGYCPPFFKLENHSQTSISDSLCTMGQLRYEKLQDLPDRRKT